MSAYYTSPAERVAAASARATVKRLAKQHNVTVTPNFDGGWHEIVLTAPKGRLLNDLHEVVIANAGPTTDRLWQRAAEDLQHMTPLETCDTVDCEWCNDDEAEAL
jgi:hypothetical protein